MESDTIRTLIYQENEMINHRMTWFLILQGFMLTGIAFGWEKSCALCGVFACIGILSSLSVGIAMLLGSQAIEKLDSRTPDRVMGRGKEETSVFVKCLLPWHLLPIVFVLGWLAILIIKVKAGS